MCGNIGRMKFEIILMNVLLYCTVLYCTVIHDFSEMVEIQQIRSSSQI